MKYTIFSVDDSRKDYIHKIESSVELERIYTECVDGRVAKKLAAAQEVHSYPIKYGALVGQLGIWYSVLNALEHAPILTFEDDAMLCDNFMTNLNWRLAELPEDADFFSLFLPRDSDHLYRKEMSVSNFLTKTYQRYGGVSMYYTEQGKAKIKSLLKRDGITGQYDDTLYLYSKNGELNGYCSKPSHSDLVYISGLEKSIVQETEAYA